MNNNSANLGSRTDWLEIDSNEPAGLQRKPMASVQAVPAAPAPAPAPSGIDEEGAARARAADAVAQRAGLAFSGRTLFAWGTRGQWGDAAARARAELHAQPLLSELAGQASRIVAAEARSGHVVDVGELAYSADDRLRRKASGKAGLPVSAQALKQLMARIGAKGGSYLANEELTGALRQPHVEHWLKLHGETEAAAKLAHEAAELQAARNATRAGKRHEPAPFEPARLKMLSKLDEKGARVLYGVVGERYPYQYGMDAVIKDVLASFPSEVRGVLVYDAGTTKWRVDAALGAEFEPVVGDIHRVGVKFGSHDAGGGSYWADLYAIRVRCVNFTKIHAGKKLGRVRHIGTIDALRKRVAALIEVGGEVLQGFSEVWKDANETAIIDRAYGDGGDARQVFRALIKAGHISAFDGAEDAVERYMQAWLKEPGETRSAYVNAVTRAAHEAPWSNPWATDDLEEQAGQLLYNHVVLSPAQMEAVA